MKVTALCKDESHNIYVSKEHGCATNFLAITMCMHVIQEMTTRFIKSNLHPFTIININALLATNVQARLPMPSAGPDSY